LLLIKINFLISKTPTETNNHVKQSFNGFCKICDPSCFDNSNDGKSFHLRIFSDTLAGYPVINKGDIIRCSNIMLWRSHMFPGQTDFKVSSAEKQIVVFPHDETREPLCVAESFKFSKEDYEQVCKLRRWYRELSHKSVNPLPTVNEYAGLDISNKVCNVTKLFLKPLIIFSMNLNVFLFARML